jgi:hypothetical protein
MGAGVAKVIGAALLAWGLAAPAPAQFWENTLPPSTLSNARVCYNDTVHDWLIAGGGNLIIMDSLLGYVPLYRYDGHSWDTLGLFGHYVYDAVIYHDTLVVGGAFKWMRQDTIKRIACYANGQWHPYGDINSGIEAAYIQHLRLLEGELYALGVFEYADGQLCNGVAKRVGGHWEPLPNWPTNFEGDPYMYDIARYQGRLVACGNFNSPGLTMMDIIQYDGNSWVPICETCLHGWMDGAGAMAVYQGYLYVGGHFQLSGGNPGQGMIRWDGTTWEAVGPPGGGIQLDNYSDTYPPSVFSFQARDDRLFFNGIFGFVNHLATPAVASWDGTNFCTLGGANFINGQIAYSFAFYHDSLYIAPSAGIAMANLLRYLDTDCTYQCGTLGVEEASMHEPGFRISWSQAGNLTLLGLQDGSHLMQVFDAQGRLVLDNQVESIGGMSQELHIPLQHGVYLLRVAGQGARFVPPE